MEKVKGACRHYMSGGQPQDVNLAVGSFQLNLEVGYQLVRGHKLLLQAQHLCRLHTGTHTLDTFATQSDMPFKIV